MQSAQTLDANTPTRAGTPPPLDQLSDVLPCNALRGCPPVVSRWELEQKLIVGGFHYEHGATHLSPDLCTETRHYLLVRPLAGQPTRAQATYERGLCTALTLHFDTLCAQDALALYHTLVESFSRALSPLTPLVFATDPSQPPQSHSWSIPRCKQSAKRSLLCLFLDPASTCVQVRLTC